MRAYGALETYLPTLSKTGSYPEAPTINLPDGTRLHRALPRGASLFGNSATASAQNFPFPPSIPKPAILGGEINSFALPIDAACECIERSNKHSIEIAKRG